jgi:hypothetical protein
MTPEYGLIVAEGPHDVQAVGTLLDQFGFSIVRQLAKLDPAFHALVPRVAPHKGDLLKRIPIPAFYSNSQAQVVALLTAGGTAHALVDALDEAVWVLGLSSVPLAFVGIVCDADDAPVKQCYSDLLRRLAHSRDPLGQSYVLPAAPGLTASGNPRFGIYVLPDNATSGTLEHLLLESARFAYPDLLQLSKRFVLHARRSLIGRLPSRDRKDFSKPHGKEKAIAASVANILRPGKAIQVSLQDNDWLKGRALNAPKVQQLSAFLSSLLNLP